MNSDSEVSPQLNCFDSHWALLLQQVYFLFITKLQTGKVHPQDEVETSQDI